MDRRRRHRPRSRCRTTSSAMPRARTAAWRPTLSPRRPRRRCSARRGAVTASGSTFAIGTTTVTCNAETCAATPATRHSKSTVRNCISGFYQPVDMNERLEHGQGRLDGAAEVRGLRRHHGAHVDQQCRARSRQRAARWQRATRRHRRDRADYDGGTCAPLRHDRRSVHPELADPEAHRRLLQGHDDRPPTGARSQRTSSSSKSPRSCRAHGSGRVSERGASAFRRAWRRTPRAA